jgi:hypothetical protein
MDIDGTDGNAVYVDVWAEAIGGYSAGPMFRVIAGTTGTWNSACDNGGWQKFNLQVKKPDGTWEDYAWILLGHIDTNLYSTGSTVISERTTGAAVQVASVANTESGCWQEHVHMEAYNLAHFSRTYNWDGPNNSTDTTSTPACIYGGGSASLCNTQVRSSDVVGYVGGAGGWAQVANPYYVEF